MAIYMGTQYAYADMVLASIPWKDARVAVAALFMLLSPLGSR